MSKWGIIGLGRMGNVFANAIKEVDNAKLLCISSKDQNKLKNFSNIHKIAEENCFNDYDLLIKNKNIDSIYIATLNNTHLDLIKKCAEAKKNILCEKPIGLNKSEAEEAKYLITKNNVKFVEAIAYYSHPQKEEVIKLLKNNEVGDVISVESSFGFKVKKVDPNSRLFNKNLGGGALLDLGCYPVSFLMILNNDTDEFIIDKKKISYSATEVDDSANASITIDNKIQATIKVSLKENYSNICIIKGTKGKILVPSPWLPEVKSFVEVQTDKRSYKIFFENGKSVYGNQINKVSSYFDGKTNNDLFSIDQSIKCMKFLDRWIAE